MIQTQHKLPCSLHVCNSEGGTSRLPVTHACEEPAHIKMTASCYLDACLALTCTGVCWLAGWGCGVTRLCRLFCSAAQLISSPNTACVLIADVNPKPQYCCSC